mmetsp:Transcript_53859/g.109779  ORF Transcript_53859/g.109779 Transcript_53859/m.109779 type:complete len:330 (+) Transcript_53859:177-1166(+)
MPCLLQDTTMLARKTQRIIVLLCTFLTSQFVASQVLPPMEPQGCEVPEPGISFLACNFAFDDSKEILPLGTPRWTSSEQFRTRPGMTIFNETVYLTNPVKGDIFSAIEQCASVGFSLATQPVFRLYWGLYTEYPGTQKIHPWKSSLIWDGHYGPAGLNRDSEGCTATIVGGRSFGAVQSPPCTEQEAIAVCASCKWPLRWDPTPDTWTKVDTSGTYKYLTGGCVKTCSPGSHDGEGACVPCLPGRYQPNTGLPQECSECAVGEFAAGYRSATCDMCPPGSFQNATGQTRCYACAAGTYQRDRGQPDCTPCPPGRTSLPGASTAAECFRP